MCFVHLEMFGKQLNALFFDKSGIALTRVEDTKLHDKVCGGRVLFFREESYEGEGR